MSRIIWRRAHPVRLPDKVNTPPHVELLAAYQIDQINRDVAERIAAERDLREMRT